jgi:hypothetical protein
MSHRIVWIAAIAAAVSAPSAALAVDHNNVDAHRPLSFDDAESLAYREQALEFGLNLGWPRRSPLGLRLDAEYLYGFARNSHASFGFEPSIGGRAGEDDTRIDPGNVSLGLLHNFSHCAGTCTSPAVAPPKAPRSACGASRAARPASTAACT